MGCPYGVLSPMSEFLENLGYFQSMPQATIRYREEWNTTSLILFLP